MLLIEIEYWGRFHQTLFAKRTVAGAQRFTKNSQFNFIKAQNFMDKKF
jgi:hypothetical protein